MTGYKLEKEIWTDEDFDIMGWHDVSIHGIAFSPHEWSLALDIDYIFRWVSPKNDEKFFQFWISPATKVFESVSNIQFDVPLTPLEPMGISELYCKRTDPSSEGLNPAIRFRIDCHVGEFSIVADSFTMFVKRAPTLQKDQELRAEVRGGFSFSRELTASE